MTPLEAAISYARRGWHIFPCHSIVDGNCTCGKKDCDNQGKHPRTFNGVKDGTTDEARITQWFTQWPESNIGLACGIESNVIAIDVDPRHGGFESLEDYESNRPEGPLPATLQAISGSGGRHILFQYPANVNVGNRIDWLPGVDVRSNGGYIVVPPSRHLSGAKYRWLNELPLATPPADLVTDLQTKKSGGSSDLPATKDILKGIPEGKRDDVLFRAACRWRRQLKDKAAVTTLVLEAAANCEPPFPKEDALVKVEQAFKQNHDDDDDDELEIPNEDDGRHLTDDGNAKRLIDAYGDELLHVEAWGWMVWSGSRWKVDGNNTVMAKSRETVQSIYQEAVGAPTKDKRKKLIKWANQSESASRIIAMMNLGKSDDRIRKDITDFDADPWILACRNGIIDLRTGDLRPHSRDDYITRYTDIVYDPDYTMPQWERFLEDSARGDLELVRYLQMAAGYTLTGDTREECLFFIHGPAAAGKSTFLDGIQTAMGEYAMVTQAETFMNRKGQGPPKDEIARFYGARMIATVEIPEGERFAEALVKQLTGGDKVAGRHLYKSGFEYSPTYKLWFATNHAPRIQDDAIWRRIKKIPFTNPVPPEKRNPQLKANVKNPDMGGKAVLAWAVRGCVDWLSHGGLITPAVIKDETNEYRLEQDKFGAFLDDQCVQGPGLEVKRDDIYSRYQTWCMMNGEKPMTSTSFTTKIKSREENFQAKRRSDGWWYIGLTLKQPLWSQETTLPQENAWS